MKKRITFIGIMILLLVSCSDSNDNIAILQNDSGNSDNSDTNADNNDNSDSSDNSDTNYNEWLVPIGQIKDGGPGKDGIPSIDNPIFVDPDDDNASYVNDEDLVIGIKRGNDTKAYPHKILDYHEIVNDEIAFSPVSVNYCPLTGTAFAWEGEVNSTNSTFGVSGLLYNSNLILYDRNTDSNWSQIKLQCINGPLIGERPQTINLVETTWGNWKAMFPETKVLSRITGFNRNYDVYPYGDYKTNHNFLLFSVSPTNNSLQSKERVYAIIDDEMVKAYKFENFVNGKAVKEVINGKLFLVVGNNDVIKAFQLAGAYSDLVFVYSYTGSEEFFTDNEGNTWNLTGRAISGPKIGQKLTSATSVVSYWFAIAAFYPNPEIFED